MRCAVTGGSGVVGSAVVRHLVAAGHEVVALARSPAAEEQLAGLGARAVTGDVLEPESLKPLCDRADWVFHVAGVNEMCSRHPERMDRVNITGTRHVVTAARAAGAARLVHTSSAVTIGQPPGTVGRETTTHRGYYLSRYERSKHLAEQVAFAEGEDLPVVAVNPSSVQGPGRTTGTGRLVLDLVRGRLPFLVDTTVSMVDIDDCARGHLLAAERGAGGERYLLSGASFTITEVLGLVAEITGREIAPRLLPGWLAEAGATLVAAVNRVVRRRPPVCREMVRVAEAALGYDGSLATRQLGLEYTPFETTIRRTVDWFRAEGLLG